MAEPVSYEQIVRELQAQRALKPWEVSVPGQHMMPNGQMMADSAMRADSPQATGAAQAAAVDPMQLAREREKLMQGLASAFGTMANPETQMAQQGAAPNPGLVQLLMGLMRK